MRIGGKIVGMFGLFKKSKKNETYPDLSWIGVDMHSHILPGIDDGSPDVGTSLELLAGLQELGLTQFICTPHIYAEIHPNDRASISAAQEQLNQALGTHAERGEIAQKGVLAAAEYMLDDHSKLLFEQANRGELELMTLPGRQVLVEMSYQFERRDLLDQLFQLQLGDYQPILAHPERYLYYHKRYAFYAQLKERGCKFQLNLLSLSGYYGPAVRKVAQNLVKEGMIEYVGTDLHHTKHLHALKELVGSVDLPAHFEGNTNKNIQLAY